MNQVYWSYIVRSLQERGYIRGVRVVPAVGTDGIVKITPFVQITPDGISYLQENSKFEKVKGFLKDIKEIVPGL